ncbi:MAG TPA: hypothetical protein PK683_13135, partial [Leptospiraceae bacterium]|nr:hypothetical protein [Leptospiraceae bacterium]
TGENMSFLFQLKSKKREKSSCGKIFFSFLLMSAVSVSAGDDPSVLEFRNIWEKISENSHTQKALAMESKAAKLNSSRASKHWHPRIYADARAYNTNDPALNFFSVLGQRAAKDSDFSTKSMRTRVSNFVDTNNNPYTVPNYNTLNLLAPDTLNNPGAHTYQRGTFGFDLSVYEGGSKSSIAKAYDRQAEGKQLENKFVSLSEYANYAAMYGTISSLTESMEKIQALEKTVKNILGRYQLGNRGNPLGYSGGLGLKSLKNRIEGMKAETSARIESLRDSIEVSSGKLPEKWGTRKQAVQAFADEYLKVKMAEQSYMARAMKMYAEGASEQAEAEKARVLPKVGLYGESYLYRGERASATAYNAGFYVQMNLYSAGDLDAVEQARLNSKAMQERANELIRNEESKAKSLLQMENALRKNLELVTENAKLMDEQVIVAQQLFGSGALNALQLSEVLSRKADVIQVKAMTESEYLKVRAAMVTLSESGIEGVKHE